MKFIIFAFLLFTLRAQGEEESNEFLEPPPDEEGSQTYPLHRTFLDDSKCMDGSPAAAYTYNGSSEDLILYFYSGGICIEDASKFKKFGDFAYIEDCAHRKNSFYGSSANFPEEFNSNQGLMGNSKYQNPHLRKAHKMFFMYCDGNMWHSQMNSQTLEAALRKFNVNAKRVILSGSGVGGWYLILQNTQLTEVIKKVYGDSTDVRLILDSVAFDISGNSDLVAAYTEASEKAGVNFKDLFNIETIRKIEIPTFIVHSQYDWWQLEIVNGFECISKVHLDKCTPKEKKQIDKIRNNILRGLIDVVKSKENWGLWAVSCVFNEMIIWTEVWNHPRYQIPMLEGGNLADNFQAWLDGTHSNHIHYDVVAWPYNKPCSNLPYGGKTDPQLDDIIRDYERKESRAKREEQENEDL